jgi:hypothetical protein
MLVNVNVEDVVIHVPIGVAANVCNRDVVVLAQISDDEAGALRPHHRAVPSSLPSAGLAETRATVDEGP